MRLSRILTFFAVRWNLWLLRRRRRNPIFRLSSVPDGNGLYIMLNEDYLFPPHLLGGPAPEKQDGHWRGTYLKFPFVLYDGVKTQLVDRLGLYRVGRYWVQVSGRTKAHEICATEIRAQDKAESSGLPEVRLVPDTERTGYLVPSPG